MSYSFLDVIAPCFTTKASGDGVREALPLNDKLPKEFPSGKILNTNESNNNLLSSDSAD